MDTTTANGDQIRFSVKELLANIERKLDTVIVRVDSDKADLSRRIGVLEARIPISDDLTQRFLRVEADFAGFERRFSKHEDAPGHTEGLKTIAAIQTEVQTLREREIASDAVAALMRQMADQRRWLIGLSMGSLVSITGLVITLWKLLSGGHL